METNLLLDTYLKELRLPTFSQNYHEFAEEAAQSNHSYDRFLLALAEQEAAQRERNRIARRIEAARFPVLKELADFDFSCISSPNEQRVLELARGAYIQKAEPILLVGNPGLGKTHVATGLALAACRQGHRVRFYDAAGLVDELILAQEEHRLSKLLATTLRHHLIVLDKLGFIPVRRMAALMIVQDVPQVKGKPVRSSGLPKGETWRDKSMPEKGQTGKPFTRVRAPETWMIWVKLDCSKSSGELVTSPPSTQRLRSSPGNSIEKGMGCEALLPGTMVSETYQTTNGHPKSS